MSVTNGLNSFGNRNNVAAKMISPSQPSLEICNFKIVAALNAE